MVENLGIKSYFIIYDNESLNPINDVNVNIVGTTWNTTSNSDGVAYIPSTDELSNLNINSTDNVKYSFTHSNYTSYYSYLSYDEHYTLGEKKGTIYLYPFNASATTSCTISFNFKKRIRSSGALTDANNVSLTLSWDSNTETKKITNSYYTAEFDKIPNKLTVTAVLTYKKNQYTVTETYQNLKSENGPYDIIFNVTTVLNAQYKVKCYMDSKNENYLIDCNYITIKDTIGTILIYNNYTIRTDSLAIIVSLKNTFEFYNYLDSPDNRMITLRNANDGTIAEISTDTVEITNNNINIIYSITDKENIHRRLHVVLKVDNIEKRDSDITGSESTDIELTRNGGIITNEWKYDMSNIDDVYPGDIITIKYYPLGKDYDDNTYYGPTSKTVTYEDIISSNDLYITMTNGHINENNINHTLKINITNTVEYRFNKIYCKIYVDDSLINYTISDTTTASFTYKKDTGDHKIRVIISNITGYDNESTFKGDIGPINMGPFDNKNVNVNVTVKDNDKILLAGKGLYFIFFPSDAIGRDTSIITCEYGTKVKCNSKSDKSGDWAIPEEIEVLGEDIEFNFSITAPDEPGEIEEIYEDTNPIIYTHLPNARLSQPNRTKGTKNIVYHKIAAPDIQNYVYHLKNNN